MTDAVDRDLARRVLDTEMLGNEIGADTIRDFLTELLWAAWSGEGDFDGRYPLNLSTRRREVYRTLVDAGLISGRLDERDQLAEADETAGNRLILAAIEELGQKP